MANRIKKNTNPRINRKAKLRTAPNKRLVGKAKFMKKNVQDARQKIILKKRSVTDARDILANKARTQDARSKLDKLRESKTAGPRRNGNIKVIGNNIVQKTDKNGKISLSTNKTSNPTSNIKLAIQKELGLVSPTRSGLNRKLAQANKRLIASSTVAPLVRRQPVIVAAQPYRFENDYEAMRSMFKWTNPAASQLINSIERPRRNELLDRTFENFSISKPIHTRTYVELDAMDDEDIPMEIPPLRPAIQLQGTSRSSNIHSRLDSHPVNNQSESHGIFSNTKTKVVLPAGHRIVVSNLQNTVSQEDIKELFEDIGDLLAARLVRPGVAEVIYKNLKDAQKAVDTYHNRQLDGQPMKCLLVNKRPLNNPTAPALLAGEMEQTGRKITSTSEKLIPDISTIHKVLFQRK